MGKYIFAVLIVRTVLSSLARLRDREDSGFCVFVLLPLNFSLLGSFERRRKMGAEFRREFKGTRMRVSVHVYASTRIRDIIACMCARRVSDTRSRDVNMGR